MVTLPLQGELGLVKYTRDRRTTTPVILRPDFGRRTFRDMSGSNAASWLFGKQSSSFWEVRTAIIAKELRWSISVRSISGGPSAKIGPQDDRRFLLTSFLNTAVRRSDRQANATGSGIGTVGRAGLAASASRTYFSYASRSAAHSRKVGSAFRPAS